jgi:starch synthase
MRVLHAVAELYPWVKSGGLGDVAAALPAALAAAGVDTRLVLPGFAAFLDAFTDIADIARLRTPYAAERVRLVRARLPQTGRFLYLVDHPPFYDRPGGPYADPQGRDWPDNHRRFGLFGWVAAALACGADPAWRPHILHGHDWHAGLAPAYLAALRARSGPSVPSVFTIHNLAYHGAFPAAVFAELALPPAFFAIDGVEFHGQVSFLKAGLYYADRLTTVSPTYAREIQTPAFGCGFEGLLRARAGVLSGILNGVDPQVWDPRHDGALPQPYGIADVEIGKRRAKAALQCRLGLAAEAQTPLFGAVGRLTAQKGLDLVLAVLPALAAEGAQLALLGSGDSALEAGYARAARTYRGRIAAVFGYDEALAHLIIAGSDVVLVPSRFEPCGLTQLYALRYGSLPLVRRVGGLADTVVDTDAVTLAEDRATGFVFEAETAAALSAAIGRALALYRQPALWRQVVRRAMRQDFSWQTAARRYLALYRELVPQA